MIIDSQPSVFRVQAVGDVPELRKTPASETPTAPESAIPGVAIDAGSVLPEDTAAEAPVEDPLTALQRRDHPFG